MIHLDKTLLGYLSILGYVGATIPYCAMVLRGKIKPHIFTWVIWALVMGIAAAARSAEGAGAGAWAQWAGAVICAITVVFALFNGERDITLSDKLAFAGALLAIPVWRATHDPLSAIIMVSLIDALGYYPTMRKSWIKPHQESVFNYLIANAVNLLSVFAATTIDFATVLYPAVLFTCNTTLVTMILFRRRSLSRHPDPYAS